VKRERINTTFALVCGKGCTKEFFIRQGFDTLNQLEITKYLKGVPKRKYTAENVEIFGYKFKRVI